MIENGLFEYSCDPWYIAPGAQNYESIKRIKGQVNYGNDIFIVSHRAGSSGCGGMSEGSPNSATIYRINQNENTHK